MKGINWLRNRLKRLKPLRVSLRASNQALRTAIEHFGILFETTQRISTQFVVRLIGSMFIWIRQRTPRITFYFILIVFSLLIPQGNWFGVVVVLIVQTFSEIVLAVLANVASDKIFRKGLFHRFNIQSVPGLLVCEIDLFSKRSSALSAFIELETSAPIVGFESIDGRGIAEYYQVKSGGIGQSFLLIDLGTMQEMTRRTLKVYFDISTPFQIGLLQVWNEHYRSRPFEESENVIERMLLWRYHLHLGEKVRINDKIIATKRRLRGLLYPEIALALS